MHPFKNFCQSHHLTLKQLSDDIGIDNATLYRITVNQGPQTTRKILEWCKRHYIDPYDVFCPSSIESQKSRAA